MDLWAGQVERCTRESRRAVGADTMGVGYGEGIFSFPLRERSGGIPLSLLIIFLICGSLIAYFRCILGVILKMICNCKIIFHQGKGRLGRG